jgi:hypothetical protein
MLRTPRDRFLFTYGAAWKKILADHTIEVEEAILTSLMELQSDLPIECSTPQMACDAHQQMIGARKVLDILCSLHQPPPKQPQDTTKSLNYSAGV